MELSPEQKDAYIETAKRLTGYERRLFMARIVKSFGPGGSSLAKHKLGWGRKTIRKGRRELESGIRCVEAYRARGRKRAEAHLPGLLEDRVAGLKRGIGAPRPLRSQLPGRPGPSRA